MHLARRCLSKKTRRCSPHPIQYQSPLLRRLAKLPDLDLEVLYCDGALEGPFFDEGFNRVIEWDTPLLGGYRHVFMTNCSPRTAGFFRFVNPSIVRRLWKGGFDAIIVHGWSSATDWITIATANATGTPIFLRTDSNGLDIRAGLGGSVKQRVLKNLFKRINGFLISGQRNAEFFKRYGADPTRFFRTPLSVDTDLFAMEALECHAQRPTVRARYGWDKMRLSFFCRETGGLEAPRRPH